MTTEMDKWRADHKNGIVHDQKIIADGDHTEVCAVCGLPLEYYSYESYMGDCDLADCEECDTHYCEGYLVGPGGGDVDVPKAQLAYLKQVAERNMKELIHEQAQDAIRDRTK